MLVSVFVRAESFCKKKINRLEIALIASIHYTTDVYLYQPAYETSIYTHLFLFVIICENFFFLWESFWIFFIVSISSYLWSSLRITSFYENHFESFLFVKMFFLWELFFIRENLFFMGNLLFFNNSFFICKNLFMKISKRMLLVAGVISSLRLRFRQKF